MLLLTILWGALQVGDVLTTMKLLNNGGRELNPVMDWLFKRFGMQNVLMVKMVLLICLGIWLFINAYILALVVGCILYALVVGWNSYQIYISR